MSYEYGIDPDRNLVCCRYLGKTSADETIACMNQVVADPKFRSGMNAMSEFVDASGDWSLADLDRFRAFVAHVKPQIGKSCWAVVIPEGKATTTARIFVALHSAFEVGIEVQLFRDRELALNWLTSKSQDEL